MSTVDPATSLTAPAGVPAPPSVRAWRWLDFVVLAIVLGLALALRVTHIDANPSFDELWHMGTTKAIGNSLAVYHHNVVYPHATSLVSLEDAGPIWAVWTRSMDGVLHPPLFVTALRAWRNLFGESVTVSHYFSITWSCVAIVFTFMTARLAFDRWLAGLVALGLACAQTQIYFAQEIRAYSMMIALGAIGLWLMTRIEVLGPTRRRLVALGLLTLPLQLTHYFAFGGALAMVIYGLMRGGRHRRAFMIAVGAAVTLFLATWLKFALRQVKDIGTGDAFLHVAHRDVVRELLLAIGTPFRLIAERDYQIEFTPVLSGVLFFLPWLLVRRFRVLMPWTLWLVLSVAPLVLLDMARSTLHVALARYLAIATPAVPLLFVGVVWPLRRWLAYVMGATVCIAGAMYLFSKNLMPLDAEDFSQVVRIIEPQIRPGDAIVTYSGGAPAYYVDVLMLTVSTSPKLVPRAVELLDAPMTPEMLHALNTRRIWLVSGTLDRPIGELIPGGRITSQTGASPLVSVLCIDIDDAPATTQRQSSTSP